jgi:hypothetical protein
MTLILTKEQKQFFAESGRVGGKTRANNLSAKRRSEIARKASKAAARVRTQKAIAKKGVK